MAIDKEESLLNVLREFSSTFEGITLDYDTMTPEGLETFITGGHKQAFIDITGTKRPPITGKKKDGNEAPGSWKDTKRISEAQRLGLTDYHNTASDKERLADAVLYEMNLARFNAILSGEYTISESGTRGDSVAQRMFALCSAHYLKALKAKNDALPKDRRIVVPTGKALRKVIQSKLETPAVHDYFKGLAETQLAQEATITIPDLDLID
jgi:hypothetical protein